MADVVHVRCTTGEPAECHRTTKANIRSHLYGGPQGWNPHFLRIKSYDTMGYKPIECRPSIRAPSNFDRCRSHHQPDPSARESRGTDQTSSGFQCRVRTYLNPLIPVRHIARRRSRSRPNAPLYLRASVRNRRRPAIPTVPRWNVVRILTEAAVTLKPVGLKSPWNPLTCGGLSPVTEQRGTTPQWCYLSV